MRGMQLLLFGRSQNGLEYAYVFGDVLLILPTYRESLVCVHICILEIFSCARWEMLTYDMFWRAAILAGAETICNVQSSTR